jgi:hypothetical protein
VPADPAPAELVRRQAGVAGERPGEVRLVGEPGLPGDDRDRVRGARRALRLKQSQSPAAGRLWQQADRTAPDRAALLPLGIQLDNVVTSQRVGNFLHQPGYGLLVDQWWVDSTTP